MIDQGNPTIALVIPYFGKWPEWSEIFFESCKRNPTVDFIFFTNCGKPDVVANNLVFHEVSYEGYCELVSRSLNINFAPKNPYKLCDLKPFFGFIHRDILNEYSFYGFCDIDLLFGDIRYFFTDKILSLYNVISTHDDRISGHLNIFKNTDENVQMPFRIKNWALKLEQPNMVTITENFLTRIYFPIFKVNILVKKVLRQIIGRENVIKINNIINKWYKKTSSYKKKKLYFVEQYTTPLTYIYWKDGTLHDDHPNVWLYENGKVTNDREEGIGFIYIHFMNFKSGKYRKDNTKVWPTNFYNVENYSIKDKILINRSGIFKINEL
jgi:hypothetical protein